jgi:hypothetical protein
LVLLKNMFLWFLNSRHICQLFCFGIHCLQMKALKDLGLDVTKGTVTTDSDVTQTKFHIMRLWVLATLCLLYFCIQNLVVCVYDSMYRKLKSTHCSCTYVTILTFWMHQFL